MLKPLGMGCTRERRQVLAASVLGALLFATAGTAEAQITFRAASSAGNPAKAITFVAASTGQTLGGAVTSITVPIPTTPAAPQAGDLAILFIVGRPTDTTEPAAPTGWTLRTSHLRELGTNDIKIMTFYRILAGGDANPTVNLPATWQNTNAGIAGQMAVWRGVNPTTPFDTAVDVTGGSPAVDQWVPPSITTATDRAWVLSYVATADDNAVVVLAAQAQGFTARMSGSSFDNSLNGDQSLGVADKEQTPAGTPTMPTWDITTSGSGAATDPWASITFALRPGDSLTLAKPTGTVENDVVIASIAVRPNTIGITPPSGWTLVRRMDNASATANSLAVYRKVAGPSEPASYTWTLSGAHTGASGGIQAFSGVDTTTSIDVENGQSTPSSLSHSTPSVTTTMANTMLVTSHGISNADTWSLPGMNEAFDVLGGAEAITGNYLLQAAAGATGVKTANSTPGPADVGNAHILALRPIGCSTVADATYVAAAAPSGTGSVTVYWSSTNPVMVLRKANVALLAGEAPANGTSYTAGTQPWGAGASMPYVVYDGTNAMAGLTCTATGCTNTGLSNGTAYYYKVFPKATSALCYAAGTGAEVSATPQAGPRPAWSYTLAGGPMLKAGIAGEGTVHTTSNAKAIVSINTADGTPTWTPLMTNEVVQSWLTWLPGNAPVAAWYNPSWTARKKIRIDKTKVGSGGVTDFPLLISLTDADVKSAAQTSGNDILFTSSDGTTKLSHEIERYTSATGELIAWVKVPSISSAVDTDLYMYYGNPAAANQQNASAVWTNGYVSVWHLKEDPGPGAAGDIKDSTTNVNHGTAAASMSSADLVPGKIGSALNFVSGSGGSGSVVDTGDQPELQLATYSWSMWLKGNGNPVCNPAGTNGQPIWNADLQFNFAWQHTGCAFNKAAAHRSAGSSPQWNSAQIQSGIFGGVWYHIAGTYGAGQLKVYLNGALEQTTAHGAPDTAAGSFSIGNGVGFTNFDGQVDEVRVSNTARSLAWLQTEYNNQSSPSTFYSVGAENASGVVIGGDQSGRVYSVDAATWATMWTTNLSANADFLQATPAAQLRAFADPAFDATYPNDVIFVGSRNAGDTNCGAGTSTTNNKVFAIQASDGAVLWTFNGTCTTPVDWIVGMPYVDYGRNRLYVASRAGTSGTQTSLWVIDTLTGALVTPPSPLTLGHLEASPTLSADGNTVYVGNLAGTLHAVDATTLAVKWSLSVGATIKGFLWEDPNSAGRLYFSTGSDVRCVQDLGASGSACAGWTVSSVAGASTLLVLDKIYVGSSDGKIHRISPTTGVEETTFPTSGTLDGTQVGDVSTETGGELFVGTSAGKVYKIPLPLP